MKEREELLAEDGFHAYFERVAYTDLEGHYFAVVEIQTKNDVNEG